MKKEDLDWKRRRKYYEINSALCTLWDAIVLERVTNLMDDRQSSKNDFSSEIYNDRREDKYLLISRKIVSFNTASHSSYSVHHHQSHLIGVLNLHFFVFYSLTFCFFFTLQKLVSFCNVTAYNFFLLNIFTIIFSIIFISFPLFLCKILQ